MVGLQFFKGSINPLNILKSIKFKRDEFKRNPYQFWEDGITIFCRQTTVHGKTLSATSMVRKLCEAYPQAVLCSNLEIKGIENAHAEFTGVECLEMLHNGEYGVIYLIDEIQNYLNSLLSKSVSMDTIVELTQQRKQRKIIIGTSQVYGRMAKPLREQVQNVVLCEKWLGFLQVNYLIDNLETRESANGQLITHTVKRFWWFHSPELYKSYDTYKKIYGLTRKENVQLVQNINELY